MSIKAINAILITEYALILISIGMSLSGFITNVYILVIVVSIAALGSSVYHPLGSTIIIHKASLSKGKSLSVFMSIASFASVAATASAICMLGFGTLFDLYGYTISLYILVALTFIMPLIVLFLPKQYNSDKH